MTRINTGIVLLAASVLLAIVATGAQGGTISLLDQNSNVAITTTSSAGLTDWTVGGQNIAPQQWFWYSVDGGTQASIDTLGLTGSGTYFSVGGGTRGGYVTYGGANGLSVEVDYLLTGSSGAGPSDLSETIRLMNTGAASQAVHFFQYSNFNLSHGTGDSVQFPNANTVLQTGGSATLQTVVTPTPNEWEANPYALTLSSLTGGHYTLDKLPNIGVSLGPNNMTWAYEWDPVIPPGGTFIISNDQHLDPLSTVPEPSTFGMLGIAALALLGIARRRV
jgi:hypothetical protein